MSYVVESGASQARRARRRRALVTLAVVVLMLFFAFWYAYSYYRSDNGHHATPRAACTTAPTKPTPGSTTVNVYNATERAGLAAKTASEIRKRGFRVATVANDPLQKTISGSAEVRYGKSGKDRATLVMGLVKGARSVQDARTDTSVDLVLGNRYRALAPPPRATPAAKATTTAPSGC